MQSLRAGGSSPRTLVIGLTLGIALGISAAALLQLSTAGTVCSNQKACPPAVHSPASIQEDAPPCVTSHDKDTIKINKVNDLEEKGQGDDQPMRIPRILHHIYLNGYQAFLDDTSGPDSSIIPDWSRSCVAMHPSWEYKLWTEDDIQELLHTEEYAWLHTAYTNDTTDCKVNGPDCDPLVLRADIARVLVLDVMGGMYLDMDVECWQPADAMLMGADVVLQGTVNFEGVTNAIMAGVKGHPLWKKAMQMMNERVSNASMLVFDRTGPNLVADAAKSLGAVHESRWAGDNIHQGEFTLKDGGGVIKTYGIGEFFTPCWAFDKECFAQSVLSRGMGILPGGQVGMHRYSGSWGSKGGNKISIHSLDVAKKALCGEDGKQRR